MSNNFDKTVQMLDVISKVSKILLCSDNMFKKMQTVMCELGTAFDIDRVYVFKNYIDNESGQLYTSMFVEWVKDRITPQIENSDLIGVNYNDVLPESFKTLASGNYVVGNIKDFPIDEQKLLVPQGIISMLLVPIFVKDAYWGFVGFDDCVNYSRFTEVEIKILTIASEMISGFMIRHQSQIDLQLNEQRWHNALEASGEGVWDYDVKAKSIFISNKGKQLLNIKKHGNNINIYDCANETLDFNRDLLITLFNTMTNLSYHEYSYNVNGQTIWIATKGSVISKDLIGRPARIVGTFSDITERKNIDLKLNEALSIAEKANKAKSSFLASMSHEIRTPLNGMIGFLRLLAEHVSSDTGKEYIRIIDSSTSTLLDIINSILDLSKVETGGITLEQSKFNFVDEIEAIARLFSATAFEKGIFLKTYIDYRLPNIIIGDQLRLRQVLSNLLSNALKFTDKDGSIFFEVSLVKATNGVATVHFSIKDTGIGITSEYSRDIFKPFTQADSSITRKYGGSGLGLSIANEFVALMGGKINIDSTVNKGSDFYFDLDFQAFDLPSTDFDVIYNIGFIELHECLSSWSLERNLRSTGCNPHRFYGVDALLTSDFSRYHAVVVSVFYTNQSVIDVLEKIRRHDSNVQILLFTYPVDVSIFDVLNSLKVKVKIRPFSMKRLRNQLKLLENVKDLSEFVPNVVETIHFSGKILVAEDNFINAKLIDIVLKKYGLSVTLVSNGEQALAECNKQKFDIILMDINMPVMDGITATKIIRQKENENNLKRIPIIALTANVMKEDADGFLSSGMDFVLNKPINNATLETVFRKYLL